MVTSEDGKPLSKPDLTRVEAEERLKEVERFKKMDEEQKKTSKWIEANRKK